MRLLFFVLPFLSLIFIYPRGVKTNIVSMILHFQNKFIVLNIIEFPVNERQYFYGRVIYFSNTLNDILLFDGGREWFLFSIGPFFYFDAIHNPESISSGSSVHQKLVFENARGLFFQTRITKSNFIVKTISIMEENVKYKISISSRVVSRVLF